MTEYGLSALTFQQGDFFSNSVTSYTHDAAGVIGNDNYATPWESFDITSLF